MINTSFLHFKGIGKANLKIISEFGNTTWFEVLDNIEKIPFNDKKKSELVLEIENSIQKLEQDDLEFFSTKLHPKEKWKVLEENFSRACFFDIETNGQNYGDNITLIICYYKNRVYQFLNGDNLDSFLDFLEDVKLLVSFNGTSFDIPMIKNYFRIPKLEIAHIDLRWLSYQIGLKGGLKKIETKLGIKRSDSIDGLNGLDAIYLWIDWKNYQNRNSLEKLIEYCTQDVISLEILAKKILEISKNLVY